MTPGGIHVRRSSVIWPTRIGAGHPRFAAAGRPQRDDHRGLRRATERPIKPAAEHRRTRASTTGAATYAGCPMQRRRGSHAVFAAEGSVLPTRKGWQTFW